MSCNDQLGHNDSLTKGGFVMLVTFTATWLAGVIMFIAGQYRMSRNRPGLLMACVGGFLLGSSAMQILLM